MAQVNPFPTTGTQEGDIAAGLISGGVYNPKASPIVTPPIIPPILLATDLTKANDANITAADTSAISNAAQSKFQTTLDKLNSYIDANATLTKSVTDSMTPTPEETATLEKIKSLDQANQADITGFNATPGNTFFTFGRQRQAVLDSTALTRQSLVNTLQSQTASRTAKLDAAKFLYDANRSALSDTLSLYKATAPDNISTQVDSEGNVAVITRNPITGQIATQKVGNIGKSKAYQTTDIKTDPNTGDVVFYGIKADGTIDTKTLSKGTGPTDLQYSVQDVGGRTIRFGFDKQGRMVSKVDLGSASNAITKDIFGNAKDIISQYKAANITREAIEKQYTDAGKVIPLEVQKALDDIYGAKQTPQSTGHWYNPFSWF